jgi:hypothetical protein
LRTTHVEFGESVHNFGTWNVLQKKESPVVGGWVGGQPKEPPYAHLLESVGSSIHFNCGDPIPPPAMSFSFKKVLANMEASKLKPTIVY